MSTGEGGPVTDWSALKGGYRQPYDPRPALETICNAPLDRAAWAELWNELHHQGDVDDASYASLPLLVEACRNGPRDWNFYGLVATIETERHRVSNPDLPTWLEDRYYLALGEAKRLALSDLATATNPLVIFSAMAVVALAAGQPELGALLSHLDTGEVSEIAEDRLGWSELYRPPK